MLIKTLLLFVAFCILVAVIFALVDNQKYAYRQPVNFLIPGDISLLQPFMNVFGNGKVTHVWHFEDLSEAELNKLKNLTPLTLVGKTSIRTFHKNNL